MGLTMAGATALSAGVNFLGGLMGSGMSAGYNAKEAQKDREFQERMYHQQVEDNIKFWNMQNEYALPSAIRQRIEDAGLNPYLMFSEGGAIQNVSAPQSAQAPHGSKASANFNTKIDLANLALLDAQIKNVNADSEKKEAEANEARNRNISTVLQNQIIERTSDAVIALKNKELEKLDREIDWLATQDFALTNMTAAGLNNIASMIDYREKYYQMDNQRMLNDFWYQVESIAIGKAHVSNELKQIAVNWYNARTNREEVNGKLKVFAEQVREISSRADLNDQEKTNKILEAYNQVLKNQMFENVGTENLGSAAGLMLLLTGNLTGRIE